MKPDLLKGNDDCWHALKNPRIHKCKIQVCSDTFPTQIFSPQHKSLEVASFFVTSTADYKVGHKPSFLINWTVVHLCFSFVYLWHTLTHHLITQLVHRPQDMLDFSLIIQFGCLLTLHTKQDTACTVCCLLFSGSLHFTACVNVASLGLLSASVPGVIWGCGLPHFQEQETVQFHLKRKRERWIQIDNLCNVIRERMILALYEGNCWYSSYTQCWER